ncbi:MAG: transcriptional repressor [Desulforhopalus sp.]|nr:transcriptional repressor [Desulforhopalus sp.]
MDRKREEWAEQRMAAMVQRLKETECRITPQRLAILEVLVQSDGHPSAEDIYRQLVKSYPTMSPATVYKTLSLLKIKGEVLELEFSDLANRYDGKKPYPHPHVICTACGLIVDQTHDGLEEIIGRVMAETGFTISTHRLDFFGICPNCRGK